MWSSQLRPIEYNECLQQPTNAVLLITILILFFQPLKVVFTRFKVINAFKR